LSSGEGLIFAVRDPIEKQVAVRDKGGPTGEYRTEVADPGVTDKRLLAVESEFASVLKVAVREGNTVSAILRQAWDTGNLRVMNKNSPLRATGAHISIVGHITREELLKHLDSTDAVNGFANRFLWVAVRRSQELPDGGDLPHDQVQALGEEVMARVEKAGGAGQPRRDKEAGEYWREIYSELSREREGLWGAVTSRAEAQVVRLSLLYALLDGSLCIRRPHLESALAAWRYSEASAAWIFGHSSGNSMADTIMEALKTTPEGLTRKEIRDLFDRHKSSDEVKYALGGLVQKGMIRSEKQATAGRPVERWYAL
jgi:hypothetical protein